MMTIMHIGSKTLPQESISDDEVENEGSNDSSLLIENGTDTEEQTLTHIVTMDVAEVNIEPFRRNSISGPIKGSSHFTVFITTLIVMIIAGSSNDFLGKLIYQIYPCHNCQLKGLHALKHEYWLTFLLTFGSFFVCTFALFTNSAYKSYAKMSKKLFLKMLVPSLMDTLVTGGRYLGMLFLSAALISILKNGSQLLFLALLRHCFHQKKLLCAEWFGIAIIIIGLLIVTMNKIYESMTETDDISHKTESMALRDNIIGIFIMISVGFAGAIRNDIEELLLKNENLESDFMVGFESLISLIFTAICGVILLIVDPFDNIDKENMFNHIYRDMLTKPAFSICFVLFLMAIYSKDTMQMKMTVLSSSLTRKLFQQIYPSGTWLMSLIAFGIANEFGYGHYGESWQEKYSWIRAGGFVIVFVGNYFYIKGHAIFLKLNGWRNNAGNILYNQYN